MQVFEHRRVEAERSLRERRERLAPLTQCLRHHGARRIWLIGSTARGSGSARSDIDLLVEGIPSRQRVEAWSECEKLAEPYGVDLVRFEALVDQYRILFLREAQLLYES